MPVSSKSRGIPVAPDFLQVLFDEALALDAQRKGEPVGPSGRVDEAGLSEGPEITVEVPRSPAVPTLRGMSEDEIRERLTNGTLSSPRGIAQTDRAAKTPGEAPEDRRRQQDDCRRAQEDRRRPQEDRRGTQGDRRAGDRRSPQEPGASKVEAALPAQRPGRLPETNPLSARLAALAARSQQLADRELELEGRQTAMEAYEAQIARKQRELTALRDSQEVRPDGDSARIADLEARIAELNTAMDAMGSRIMEQEQLLIQERQAHLHAQERLSAQEMGQDGCLSSETALGRILPIMDELRRDLSALREAVVARPTEDRVMGGRVVELEHLLDQERQAHLGTQAKLAVAELANTEIDQSRQELWQMLRAEETENLNLRQHNHDLGKEAERFRARASRDMEQARRYSGETALRRILPIMDDLERATSHESASGEQILAGVRMVLRQFEKAASKMGVTRIASLPGLPFDPAVHEALLYHPSDEVPAGTILQLLRPGYLLHDRLLVPAQVVVAALPQPGGDHATSSNEVETAPMHEPPAEDEVQPGMDDARPGPKDTPTEE